MRRPALLAALVLLASSPALVEPPAPSLDLRKPLPLPQKMAEHQKENMRGHLRAVSAIVAALGTDDFAGIEVASKNLGFTDAMGQMCTHMGAAAPGFAEQAIAFHHTADGIAAAARTKNHAAVLSALSATLQTCTACHEQWKQEIVDDATYRRLSTPVSQPSAAH